MIKFLATNQDTGRRLLGFGVTPGNISRLIAGQPIKVDLSEMDKALDLDLLIFFGESEETMHAWFQEFGMIGPETKIKIDPKLREGS